MRILLLTQLFQPEPNFLKGLRFAQQLKMRGHSVQVLTGFPNYPGGNAYPGYSRRPWLREDIEGIEVIRVPHYFSHDRSGVQRVLSYLSFAISATVLGVAAINRPDVIHVYQGPATLMIPAAAIGSLRGGRIVLDIQDLWPESVTASGLLKSAALERLLERFCRWTYRRASRIVVLSEGFRDRLVEIGVPPRKIDVVYNWCDETALTDTKGDSERGFADVLQRGMFSVVYAGSIGPLQGLDSVIDAASLLQTTQPNVRFVFVGDGIDAKALRQRAQTLALDNVIFVPRQPPEKVSGLLAQADALLIHLKDDALSRGAIPQKTQAYLAAGRPVIVGVSGEASALVEKAGAGVRCRAGDPADIARVVADLAALPESAREKMGRSGREFYLAHLSFARGCNTMAGVFQNVVAVPA